MPGITRDVDAFFIYPALHDGLGEGDSTHADAAPITSMTGFVDPQSFHRGDHAFYYMNIRENVAKRIAVRKASGKGTEPGSAS